ncbi:hypothetical protein K1I48_14205 [Bacillus licheniformis]|uniref:hypothetical protein n=1 Tax=Bacillus licheniformis TaxID=1402 RepID=UPI00119F0F4E|nr:hypothetical protein [Bacillus licheniformis]MBW7634618.1 hypothetical protein [Bacillus licheniformis]TWM97070.1 hypothetical protein CHCC14596_2504 [Bacillus licheniformis]
MRKYEEKEVTKTESVLVEVVCDTCGKTIDTKDRSKDYYKVTTHRSRWGNDSIDSIRYLDFCSYECLLENMNDYFKNGADTDCYEIKFVEGD